MPEWKIDGKEVSYEEYCEHMRLKVHGAGEKVAEDMRKKGGFRPELNRVEIDQLWNKLYAVDDRVCRLEAFRLENENRERVAANVTCAEFTELVESVKTLSMVNKALNQRFDLHEAAISMLAKSIDELKEQESVD